MYMKVFPHGRGGGDGPTHYLVRPDYPGRDELPPEVLRGDVETTRALIDWLDTKWKFTAGVLSWHPDDKVTAEQERRVMDDFEQVAFAGLEPDQRNILWVRHSHAGHHELHFVIPRVELSSGKAFNPCPPGWQKHFDVFRDLHNIREDWARPDDPARARLHTPEHADLHNARLLRWGKTPNKDERGEAKEAIHAYLAGLFAQGMLTSRADVITALQETGLEIHRSGKNYITVKDPKSGEKLRLKGGIYAEHWHYNERQCSFDVGRAYPGQDRTGAAGNRGPDPAAVQRLAAKLERVIETRARYNRGRYPITTHSLGKGRGASLRHADLDVRQAVLASPAVEFRALLGSDFGRLGADALENKPDSDLESGIRAIENLYSRSGENRGAVGGQNLGAGTDRKQGWPLYHSATQGNPENRLDLRNSAGRQTGVNHDRIGTHAQRNPTPHGTGNGRHLANSLPDTDRTTTGVGGLATDRPAFAGGHRPDNRRTTTIATALAELEHCTRELETALVALERFVERQIERARERQRSRGPEMSR